jgi:hypothetical protein
MALGLALVPRRGAGLIMGAAAALTLLPLMLGYTPAGVLFTKGAGSTTSPLLAGPMLELTTRPARRGWRLYLAFILAGVLVNLAALLVQGGSKLAGWDAGGGKPLAVWLATALWSYPLCGACAGLFSAVCWFHGSGERPRR